MKRKSFSSILFLFFIMLLVSNCGVNEEQRNFEQEALSPPEGITEMTATGVPVEGEEADASDWRIAPEFRGLIDVQTPAYPNPVAFNGAVRIDLFISGIQAVNGLQVFVYRPLNNTLDGPFYVEMQTNPGLLTVTLAPQQFARTGTGDENLYRIVIYDGVQNIITYGDIKVN